MSFLGHVFLCLLWRSLPFVSGGSPQNTCHSPTKHTCHLHECSALVHLKNSFHIDEDLILCDSIKRISWRNESDCCEWNGVTCNPITGHVIGLDLSCAGLTGPIYSNNTLFLLAHLQSLNLAFNSFSHTVLPPNFGNFPHLKYLNLSFTRLSGNVPMELSLLHNLTSLDLSSNEDLIMPNLTILENLVGLKELHLSYVSIPSFFPESLASLHSLESLRLSWCGLSGELPSDILAFPRLRVLELSWNDQLYTGNLVELSDWSSPLEILDLSSTNFSRQLPHFVGPTLSNSLRTLLVSNCSVYGPIPAWVWNATHYIDLSLNNFTGELPLSLNTTHLSSLSTIDLSHNSLNGIIPSWLFHLPSVRGLLLNLNHFTLIEKVSNVSGSNLKHLDLSSNCIRGSIELNMFSDLKHLVFLELSNNNNMTMVSTEFNPAPSFPNLRLLGLSSCNISKFPFLIQPVLVLDLSNNNIQGEIPKWLCGIQIANLNISHNQLTTGIDNLPWDSLQFVDISYNMIQGKLPARLSNVLSLFASSNRISGSVDLSLCKANRLTVLDLSNNTLAGEIPHCLGNSSKYLEILNLGSNNFRGSMPVNFSSCDALVDLDLSSNCLEGVIPRSLAHCNNLKVLNLGNNNLIDTFPDWLGMLPNLQVLVLHSNYFHGDLIVRSYSKQLFSKLRILDLSKNRFSGRLPSKFILNMQGMRHVDKSKDYVGHYLREADPNGYAYGDLSVIISVKGYDRVERILNTLATIDVSSNMFEGVIPSSIGELHALRWLNLSHNKFSKQIPRSVGSLKLLESLDLSCNNLSGKIPQELGSLTFLEVFNVSENQLVGPILGTTQLSSLDNSSYLGNSGLCGPPLSKKCPGGHTTHQPPPTSIDHSDTKKDWMSEIHLWEVILIGYCVGWAIGVFVGYFILLARNPLWLSRLVYQLEYQVLQLMKILNRRHQTRQSRN